MNKLFSVLLVGALLAGCEELEQLSGKKEEEQKAGEAKKAAAKDDPSIPAGIDCESCGETVSKLIDSCLKCGHPVTASIEAHKKKGGGRRETSVISISPKFFDPLVQASSSSETAGKSLDAEPTGEEKTYEIKGLITNLSNPKTRYLSVDLVAEGLASDFEKIMEENEFRIKADALNLMSSYGYEDSQQAGFMERVNIDLRKRLDALLQKHRQGDSPLITNLYFTQFVIQ